MYLHTASRETTSLDGTWQAFPDPYRWFEDNWFEDSEVPLLDNPEVPADYDVDDGYSVSIPGHLGEQVPEFRYYEGLVWHTRRFDWTGDGDRVFIRFGAVNETADVWLNGDHVGHHEGGYTPFTVEVSDAIQPRDNLLVVGADNSRRADGMPAEQTDWFNFGGIFRSVEVMAVSEPFVRNLKVDSVAEDGTLSVSITAWIEGHDETSVEATFPTLGASCELDERTTAVVPGVESDSPLTVVQGVVEFDLAAVERWQPATPRLYEVVLTCGDDRVSDRVGFRELSVEGGTVLLNGEPIEFRGVSMHEEAAGRGRGLTDADIEQRFEWLGELGCNFARLAHYPHTREMAQRADEEGILLWEEVPAYWQIDLEVDSVRALYRQQLRELIQRDWNRPSVAFWSIANETDHEDDVRNQVLPEMAAYVRDLDETRLVTAACWVEETDDGLELLDPLVEALDVVGVNEYFGWYEGETDDMRRFVADPTSPPVIVSETGAGAAWGNRGAEDEQWTEEFQAAYYQDSLAAIANSDRIVGQSPWILFDFRSPRRMNPHQRGYNRKGLLDERGRKKLAFEVLRDRYRS